MIHIRYFSALLRHASASVCIICILVFAACKARMNVRSSPGPIHGNIDSGSGGGAGQAGGGGGGGTGGGASGGGSANSGSSGSNDSGGAAGAGDGTVSNKQSSQGQPINPSDDSDPQVSEANLVDFDNARASCDFADIGSSNYKILCQAVKIRSDGKSVVPSGLAPGTTIVWQKPALKSGAATVGACQTGAGGLSQTCDVKTQSSNVLLSVDLKISQPEKKLEKTETAVVILPFSVGVTAGFIPDAAQFYQAGTDASLTAATADPGAHSSAAPILRGFQTKELDPFTTPIGYFSSICVDGNSVFIATESSVWDLRDGKLTLFAGSLTARNNNDISHRLRLVLNSPRIFCTIGKLIVDA